jgi:sugar phosphate isomerase/epimerase
MDRLEIAIAKSSWAGFRAVELDFGAYPEMPEEELVARLRANELEVAAIATGALVPGKGPAGLDDLARVGRIATLARRLDCGVVVIPAPAEGEIPQLAESLGMLDRALAEVPTMVCLVNRRGTILAEPRAFTRLWDHGVPQRVGLALNPGEAILAGWDPLDPEALPAKPRHLYLNEAANGRIVPPGEGELDLTALAAALRVDGYEGSITLALENADPWDVEPAVRRLHEEMLGWFGASLE